MPEEFRLILKKVDEPGYTPDIDCYMRHGGYETLRKVLAMQSVTTDEDKTKTPQEQVRDEAAGGRVSPLASSGPSWTAVVASRFI